MKDVHFRLPDAVVRLVDAGVRHGVFASRSIALRNAVSFAAVEDFTSQGVYDLLARFAELKTQFGGHLLQENLAGNPDPLRNYVTEMRELLSRFPAFWQHVLLRVLHADPEYRVADKFVVGDSV